jgi:hypothetical protein
MTTEAMLAALGWLLIDEGTAENKRSTPEAVEKNGATRISNRWPPIGVTPFYTIFELPGEFPDFASAVSAAYNDRFQPPVERPVEPDEDRCETSQADLEVARLTAALAASEARGDAFRDRQQTDNGPLYRRTIEAFGQPRQVLKALEELGEYTAAISRFFAGDSENLSEAALKAQLTGEMADAEIMRRQVMLMAGIADAELAAVVAVKLARLEKLVKAKEERTDSGTR